MHALYEMVDAIATMNVNNYSYLFYVLVGMIS